MAASLVLKLLLLSQGGKNAKEQPPYGADVLRLWVASVDYNSDVLIGGRIISQVIPPPPPPCPSPSPPPITCLIDTTSPHSVM